MLDEEGREVPGGGKGYKYFGRARELPGVKELFERQFKPEDEIAKEKERGGERRAELRQRVDAGYYGYNLDEEDGTLLAYEHAKEKEAWDNFMDLGDEIEVGERRKGEKVTEKEEWVEIPGDAGDGVRWRVPTLEEVSDELVDRRKRKLLDKLG